eukprot:TRINITY_DN6197_c0_g1_i4.p1 TRINITY_DN6197_c0_g1~~TRINITY_DN6197_c0_g1_i4.p1  ORF type:complete len:207 (+),score=42.00 TRINITY_DN6197_c0_g1_i4:81-701(+)
MAMKQDDLYKLFGRETAAGRALFNIYKKNIVTTVPAPKQKTPEQIAAEIAAAKPKPKPKPNVHVPKFGRKVLAPTRELPMRRKPFEAIQRETNDYEPEKFQPSGLVAKKDFQQEKERLQTAFSRAGKTADELARETLRNAPRGHYADEGDDLSAKDILYDELVSEIAERQAFLEEMTTLGQRKQYEAQIKAEISERMAQLRKLESS